MRKRSSFFLCLFVLSTNCGRTGLETFNLDATFGGASSSGGAIATGGTWSTSGTTFLLSSDVLGRTSATGGSWTSPASTISTGGTSGTGGTAGAKFIAAGVCAGLAHTCALLNNGTVQCWGYNYDGELGNGTEHGLSLLPVAVATINNATAVSAGGGHTCAMLNGGSIQCWGFNQAGELGNGTTTDSSVPVTVSGISNAVAVAADDYHTCAVLSAGTVQCWGYNYNGELGNGTTTDSTVPVTVSSITSAVAIAAGNTHTCAIQHTAIPPASGIESVEHRRGGVRLVRRVAARAADGERRHGGGRDAQRAHRVRSTTRHVRLRPRVPLPRRLQILGEDDALARPGPA